MPDATRAEEHQRGSPLYKIIILTLTAIIVGAISSWAAIEFIELAGWLNKVLLVSPRSRVQFEEHPWLMPMATVLIPAAGELMVGILIHKLAPANRAIVRPAAAGLCLGFVGLWLPDILGMGTETLRFATIESAFTIAELPLLIDVLTGALFWMLGDTLFNLPNSGVVFSNLIAHHVFGRSLFDVQLLRSGVDLSTGRDQAQLQAAKVLDYQAENHVTVHFLDSTKKGMQRIAASEWTTAFVLDDNGGLMGIFTKQIQPGTVGSQVIKPAAVFDETTGILDGLYGRGGLGGFVGDAVPMREYLPNARLSSGSYLIRDSDWYANTQTLRTRRFREWLAQKKK